jgi:hypothetical protein
MRHVTSEATRCIICRGLRRFRVKEFPSGFPYLVARIEEIAGVIDISVHEKQDLLETLDVTQLLDKLLGLLAKRIQVLQPSRKSANRPSRPCHRSSASTFFANSFAKSKRNWATTTSNRLT